MMIECSQAIRVPSGCRFTEIRHRSRAWASEVQLTPHLWSEIELAEREKCRHGSKVRPCYACDAEAPQRRRDAALLVSADDVLQAAVTGGAEIAQHFNEAVNEGVAVLIEQGMDHAGDHVTLEIGPRQSSGIYVAG